MAGLSLSLLLSGSTNVLLAVLIIYTKQNKTALEKGREERAQLQDRQQDLSATLDRHELLIDAHAADLSDVEDAVNRNDARLQQLRAEHSANRGQSLPWEERADGGARHDVAASDGGTDDDDAEAPNA